MAARESPPRSPARGRRRGAPSRSAPSTERSHETCSRPILGSASTSATLAPATRAASAAVRPAVPPPTTITSISILWVYLPGVKRLASRLSVRRLLGAAAAGYLLGVVPSAAVAARLARGGSVDVRRAGTGNPGGANVSRLLGRRAGLAVTCADITKGAVACRVGRAVAGDAGAHLAGVAAVAGHCYPAQARFRGGMGVATSFGQCLATFPIYAPLDAGIAVAVAKLAPRRQRVALSLLVSSSLWAGAGVAWWRRGLPNLWGPKPSPLLPLANAATSGLIASRGVLAVRKARRSKPDPAP